MESYPNVGAHPPDRTEVRVLYDDNDNSEDVNWDAVWGSRPAAHDARPELAGPAGH
jgi:hypothetical protein